MKPINREIVLKSYLEHKDVIDRYVENGIEKYRKGDFTLKFSDNGKKKIKITHKKHSFLFGKLYLKSYKMEGNEKH